jgi:hypothetical protein
MRKFLDIQAAFNRFEEYRDGFGLKFLQELELAYEYLRRHPRIGRLYANKGDAVPIPAPSSPLYLQNGPEHRQSIVPRLIRAYRSIPSSLRCLLPCVDYHPCVVPTTTRAGETELRSKEPYDFVTNSVITIDLSPHFS